MGVNFAFCPAQAGKFGQFFKGLNCYKPYKEGNYGQGIKKGRKERLGE